MSYCITGDTHTHTHIERERERERERETYYMYIVVNDRETVVGNLFPTCRAVTICVTRHHQGGAVVNYDTVTPTTPVVDSM